MDWVGWLIVGITIGLILAIVLPISPRVRNEPRIPPDVEASVLIGREPVDRDEPEPSPKRRDFDPGELRALRELGEDD